MRIFITGNHGQLAQSVVPILAPQHDIYAFDKLQLDITKTDLMRNKLVSLQPNYVLNFASYNHVDLAQIAQKKQSFMVNHQAVKQLAILTRQYEIGLIHISSNYVFAGTEYHMHNELDTCQPINYYGLTKYQGEQAILTENPAAIIIRTSSLFSPFGNNFITKIIQQIKTKQTIAVINDVLTQPTSCHSLALFIQYLLEKYNTFSGLIHFTNETIYSWYEYARLIVQQYSHLYPECSTNVIAIQSPSKNNIRPKYALLDNTLRKQFYQPDTIPINLEILQILTKLENFSLVN